MPLMVGPFNLRSLAWAVTTILEVILLSSGKKSYVLAVILQSILLPSADRYLGPKSMESWEIAWGSQAVVIGARWFAVTEIARKVMEGYGGIWGMVRRVRTVVSLCVLVYAIAVSQNHWTLMVPNADRALELCIGSFIVGMFLFGRYYRLPMTDLQRLLAVGFCLYSCSWVITDTIYENWRGVLWSLCEYLNIFAYFGSLLLWIGGARRFTESQEEASRVALSPGIYGELSQELNSRLLLLNSRLHHLLRSEDSRS